MDTLLNIIKTWIHYSTTVISDCWAGYTCLPKESTYTHHCKSYYQLKQSMHCCTHKS
jgi:hypothetical protein